MHASTLLLGLMATAATAIDVKLHMGNDCNGLTYVYANRNPSDCTNNGETWTSASFVYIPKSWNINAHVHSKKGCDSGSQIRSQTSNKQAESICFTGSSSNKKIRGAKYGFVNKRRGEEAVQGECKGPDFLELEDGTRFNVAGVEESALAEMTKAAMSGTIPESLEALREVAVTVRI